MPITIYDIAKKAGVSPSTVSRVLNDSTLVSRHTKDRVRKVAGEMGYLDKPGKGPYVDKQRKTIAVFVSSVINPTLAQMVKGVQTVVKEHGLSMILFDSDGKADDERLFIDELHLHGVSGLVLTSPHFSSEYLVAIRQLGLPFVLAMKHSVEPDIPCVYINNLEASFAVMQTLFQMGHRDIAIIGGPEGDLTIHQERLQGCRLAYMAQGQDFSDDWVIEGDFSVESGYEAAVTVVEEWNKLPSCIFAFNDLMAIGVMKALQDKGIRIPEQISVIGFDGIDFSSIVNPALSTVVQPNFQIGRESASMLVRMLNDEPLDVVKNELPYEIVLRESLCSLAKGGICRK